MMMIVYKPKEFAKLINRSVQTLQRVLVANLFSKSQRKTQAKNATSAIITRICLYISVFINAHSVV
jgi:hypothetical protein